MPFVIAFLAAENENRQLEDLPQPILAVYLKYLFCQKGKSRPLSNFCKLEVTAIVCFCNDLTHFFILSLIEKRTLQFFLRGWISLFYSLIEWTLFVFKGYFVHEINKTIQVACRYGISLLLFNWLSYSLVALTRELSSWTLEDELYTHAMYYSSPSTYRDSRRPSSSQLTTPPAETLDSSRKIFIW